MRGKGVDIIYTLGWYAGLMILCVMMQVVAIYCGADLKNPHFLRTIQSVQSIAVFIIPVWAYAHFRRKEKFFDVVKANTQLKGVDVALICIMLLFALPAISLLAQWNEGLHLPESMHEYEAVLRTMEQNAADLVAIMMLKTDVGTLLLNLLVIAAVAAVAEEVFFRGWLQNALVECKINHHMAIWVTALIFSAIHMQFFGFVPRLLLGAVLGYIYYYSGSLWGSILFHFLNNAVSIIAMFIDNRFDIQISSIDAYDYAIPSLVCALVVVVLINKMSRRKA